MVAGVGPVGCRLSANLEVRIQVLLAVNVL